jgi:hypothetical protein
MKLGKNYKLLVLINLTLLVILSNYIAIAQNARGMVLEATSKKPLAGVSIYINKTGIGTTTNENGEFRLEYPVEKNRNDTIMFSSIGYASKMIIFSDL